MQQDMKDVFSSLFEIFVNADFWKRHPMREENYCITCPGGSSDREIALYTPVVVQG